MIIAALLGASISVAASGPVRSEITRYDFDTHVAGGRNLSFVAEPAPETFADQEDGFRVYQVGGDVTIPASLRDDSAQLDPADTLGIVDTHPLSGKLDKWFGSTDLLNPNNPSGTATATWQFDVSGHPGGIAVSVDMAAMGDFDISSLYVTDAYHWTWSVDGSQPAPLFTSSIEEGGVLTYTLAGGGQVTLIDPMRMNGVLLRNTFQTFLADIPMAGDVLTIQLRAAADGSMEAFAFDNVVVYAAPEPATGLLLTVGVLAARRRREKGIVGARAERGDAVCDLPGR